MAEEGVYSSKGEDVIPMQNNDQTYEDNSLPMAHSPEVVSALRISDRNRGDPQFESQ